jgi:hypothetical protein
MPAKWAARVPAAVGTSSKVGIAFKVGVAFKVGIALLEAADEDTYSSVTIGAGQPAASRRCQPTLPAAAEV